MGATSTWPHRAGSCLPASRAQLAGAATAFGRRLDCYRPEAAVRVIAAFVRVPDIVRQFRTGRRYDPGMTGPPMLVNRNTLRLTLRRTCFLFPTKRSNDPVYCGARARTLAEPLEEAWTQIQAAGQQEERHQKPGCAEQDNQLQRAEFFCRMKSAGQCVCYCGHDDPLLQIGQLSHEPRTSKTRQSSQLVGRGWTRHAAQHARSARAAP